MRKLSFLLLTALTTLTACSTYLPQPESARPAPAQPVPEISRTEERALLSIVAMQDRLYRVGAPLLVNNTPLCKGNARNLLGFTAKNKYSYSSEFIDVAQQVLSLNDRLQVMGVLTGGGASKAGVKRSDILIAVNDKPLPQGQNAERQTATILAPLVSGKNSVKLSLVRNNSNIVLNVPLTPACAFGIELGNADHVNAYGDGYRVMVTRGMLSFTQADEELAYVLAKEMAHNALSHAQKQKMSATIGEIIDNLVRIHPDLSTMGGMAGIKPMPQEMDAAADKLALYMIARAGYDIDRAPAFWLRLASQYPATVLNGYNAIHPATAFRLAAMEKTIAEIKNKQKAQKPLLP